MHAQEVSRDTGCLPTAERASEGPPWGGGGLPPRCLGHGQAARVPTYPELLGSVNTGSWDELRMFKSGLAALIWHRASKIMHFEQRLTDGDSCNKQL
eukprot:9419109-Alexandrium_andersonii.AAC.1